MSRRLLLLLGLLTFPMTTANALGGCTTEPAAKAMLSLPPISNHYVSAVIMRLEAGIANSGSDEVEVTEEYKAEWLPRLSAAMNRIIDSDIAISKEQKALFEQTACVAYDQAILEAAIEEIRCELNRAYEEGRSGSLPPLIDLLGFAHDRLRIFLEGYADPFIEDAAWHRMYSFDNPVALETTGCLLGLESTNFIPVCVHLTAEECQEAEGVPFGTVYGCLANGHQLGPETPFPTASDALCPFHTDYLPPMAGGYQAESSSSSLSSTSSDSSQSSSERRAISYGCDLKTRAAYGAYGPAVAEMRALEKLLEERDIFIKGMSNLGEAVSAITDELDLSQFGSTVSALWDHRFFKGCFEQILRDPLLPQELKDKVGLGSSSSSSRISRSSSSQSPDAVISNLLYQLGMTRLEPRGPFSFEKNETSIIKKFVDMRTSWARRRPSPLTLTPRTASSLFVFDLTNLLDAIVRSQAVLTQDRRSLQQAVGESVAAAKLVDAPIRLKRRMATIEQGARELGTMAHNLNEGMRNFGRGLAWYILRSCLGRPGAAELEVVLRLIMADNCFPYTEGDFIHNFKVHESCLRAAGLERPTQNPI